MSDLECAGHLEVTDGPNDEPRFSLRGIALRPGDRIEILLGLDEWVPGEFAIADGRVPSIRLGGDVVRIRRFAFLRLPHERCQ